MRRGSGFYTPYREMCEMGDHCKVKQKITLKGTLKNYHLKRGFVFIFLELFYTPSVGNISVFPPVHSDL